MADDEAERRSSHRGRGRSQRFDVEVAVLGAAGVPGKPIKGIATDVGTGGAFLLLDWLPVGATMSLAITLPATGALVSQTLTLVCVVRWGGVARGERGVGVQFQQPEVDVLLALSNFLDALPVR